MTGYDLLKVTTPMRDMLLSDDAVKKMVGSKIMPIVAKSGTAGDFILYQRDEFSIERNNMGNHAGTGYPIARVFITCVSDSYMRSQEIAIAAAMKLDDEHTLPGGKLNIQLEDSTETYADEKYFQILMFKITITN